MNNINSKEKIIFDILMIAIISILCIGILWLDYLWMTIGVISWIILWIVISGLYAYRHTRNDQTEVIA
jgi:hypothetical protein